MNCETENLTLMYTSSISCGDVSCPGAAVAFCAILCWDFDLVSQRV